MTGFELQTFDIGSDRSANWAKTNAQAWLLLASKLWQEIWALTRVPLIFFSVNILVCLQALIPSILTDFRFQCKLILKGLPQEDHNAIRPPLYLKSTLTIQVFCKSEE